MATPAKDLREWIALLEREGELQRIATEADPDLEITEITDRVVKAGGPALLFEHPKGSQHPLLINQFGTERRMCLAFGVDSLDQAAADLVEAVGAEGEAHAPLGPELVDQQRMLGIRVLEEERRPAGLDDAVDDLGDLQVRVDLGGHADELLVAL